MEEIWKDVKGFESLYMVSNLGRVKNVPHYVTRKYYRPSTGDNICLLYTSPSPRDQA